MSLPEEYRTARFKSLPQGLMAEAEAIIKKKFGIKEEKKAPKVKTIDTRAKEMMDMVMLDPRDAFVDPLSRSENRFRVMSRRVRFSWGRREFLIEVQCPSCGFHNDHEFSINELPAHKMSHIRATQCRNCISYIEVEINGKDCHDAYRSSERDRFDPRHDSRFTARGIHF